MEMQLNKTFNEEKVKNKKRVKIWSGYDKAENLEKEINKFIQNNVLTLSDIKFNVIDKELGEHHSAYLIYTPIDSGYRCE